MEKGHTEWRSVTSAKPLFPGHYQPHIPADLGFYDLRLKDSVLEQVKMAKEYGVNGFLYWHYWFGERKQLLETPFNNIVKDKEIDFPFAASWDKKQWGAKGQNKCLVEQQYLGEQDYTDHFYSLIEAFRDKRYIRIDGKLLFIVYQPLADERIADMLLVWRKLAKKEGIEGFYFVGHDLIAKHRDEIFKAGYDAVYNDNMLNVHHRCSAPIKAILHLFRTYLHIPTVFKYKKAIKHMIREEDYKEDTIPVIVPNWDHTPRTGCKNIMFKDCKPIYFKELVEDAISAIKNKSEEKQIVFIKSWNEWGEGNHMEPDLKYGRGYLEALCQAYARQKNLDIVIPRFTRSYGPTMLADDTKAISQFIKKGLAGENIVLKSEGNQYYSYTYVSDAISGLMTVLLKGKSGEAYNISDEASDIKLKDLAQLIADLCKTKVVFELPEENEKAGYSQAMKARLNGAKLQELGWKARYEMKVGVERTINILC